MTRLGDYNICITARHDRFPVKVDDISRLIDFLDTYGYLDGPDREHSRLVLRSSQETKIWEPYARLDPEQPVQHLLRRHVHVLYSPAVPEEQYRNYGELLHKLDNLMPRDTPFVASLGLCSRRLDEIIYCPVPRQKHRWIDFMSIHVVQGYHPLWQRIWVPENDRKEWQLQAVKAFILMISCKVNGRGEYLSIEEFVEILRLKAEFVQFLSTIGGIIGTKDFELIGGSTE